MNFDVRTELCNILGIDLTEIHGIGATLVLKLIAECGTDMSCWPTSKHFTSWQCLAPANKISGGKVLSSRTRKSSNRVSTLLRLAIPVLGKTDSALGGISTEDWQLDQGSR
uniref:transposase n=1 Tax=Pelodictyon phaeoclathratiforme TaxID=34090 RepID=UPI0009FE687E|nr:transposase [Pelodictyon phaeoclathratiforme]